MFLVKSDWFFLLVIKDVSSKKESIVGIIWIFIFALLLKIGSIRIVVNCLIKIMNIFIGQDSVWVVQDFVIIVEAKLCFTIVQFIRIVVVMIFKGLISVRVIIL